MKAALVCYGYVGVLAVWIATAGGAEEPYDKEKFEQELNLAVGSRDSRVEHLRKALEYRPNHPANLRIEERIGLLFSQWSRPPEEPAKYEEALEVFESICNRYNHMDYYELEGPDSLEGLQGVMPRSAIFAGDMCMFTHRDPERARKWYLQAMTYLQQTSERRGRDWKALPRPTKAPSDSEKGYRYHLKLWQEKQQKAEEGDVLNDREAGYARIAVKHYGMSYGPMQPEMVPVHMDRIIKTFPGTPMARVAQEHIQRATQMDLRDVREELISEGGATEEAVEIVTPEPLPADNGMSARDARTVDRSWVLYTLGGAVAAVLAVIAMVGFMRRSTAAHGTAPPDGSRR